MTAARRQTAAAAPYETSPRPIVSCDASYLIGPGLPLQVVGMENVPLRSHRRGREPPAPVRPFAVAARIDRQSSPWLPARCSTCLPAHFKYAGTISSSAAGGRQVLPLPDALPWQALAVARRAHAGRVGCSAKPGMYLARVPTYGNTVYYAPSAMILPLRRVCVLAPPSRACL